MSLFMSDLAPAKDSKARVFCARLLSTLILWAIVTGVFLSSNVWLFMALMSSLGFLGVWEYFRMARQGGVPCQPRWGLCVSIVYLGVLAWLLGSGGHSALDLVHGVDAAFITLTVLLGFVWQLRRPVDGHQTFTEVAVTTLGFIYVVVMFSFVSRLLFLPQLDESVPGAWLIIWLVLVTKFTDMGAYVTGSLIGKHKMIPHISIGLSILLSLLAVVGDLAESVLKRSMGVKDSGNTLPGIGGVLDLIDSLCYTAPVLYFVLKWAPACCSSLN
jgi:phosphatidate cytidylyltransferase